MTRYVGNMLQEHPSICLSGSRVASPWNENLFKMDEDSPRLSNTRSGTFHTVTAQGLFLCKRAHPDICPAMAYLTTRVTCSTESDWEKLTRLMKYLKQTAIDRLTLGQMGPPSSSGMWMRHSPSTPISSNLDHGERSNHAN
jgi:hypothetical protein